MTKYLFIAIANVIISFILFRSLYLRKKSTWLRAILVMAAFVLAVPAVLFSSNYLLYIPYESWFVDFHSLTGAEASSGLVGSLLGIMFASSRLRPNRLNIPILAFSTIITVMLLIAPFAKQLFFGLNYSELENKWENGICQQTSSSTCVPASCATVVRMLGGNLTERELAEEAGTTKRGTEVWYIKRAMRKHGYEIDYHVGKSPKDAPVPSILGVMVGSEGHVVVLLSKNDTGPEIGDPLGVHRQYTWKAFEKRYRPYQVYYVIRPMRRQ